MTDADSSNNERPGLRGAWQLVRNVIVTLSREDGRRGREAFGARALRTTIVSSFAGAFSGLIPAFVALGIAGVARGASPSLGPLAFTARLLDGAASYVWVLTSLVLVATAVSFGFIASRGAASFSADATATLRLAMMRHVIASSPRALDALTPHAPVPPRAVAEAAAKAPAKPRTPGTEIVKLAVLRDGQMASELIVATISNLPQTLFALVLLIVDVTATGSGLAAGLGIGVFLLSRIFASRASARVSAATVELNKSDALAFAQVGEKVSHLDDLRLAGARDAALGEVELALRETADKRQLVARAAAVSGQTASLVSTLAPLVVLLSLSATGRSVSPPEVARLLIALPLIIARMGAIDALRIAAIEKRPVLRSVQSILSLPVHPPPSGSPVGIDAVRSTEIVFDGVSFQPRGAEKPILDGIRFTIPAGSVVGLCGASGSGKSTLLRLLLRLDDPTAGRITVGGVDLSSIDPDALPSLFGALAQGGKLLPRSVEDNVLLGASAGDRSSRRTRATDALVTAQIPELGRDDGLDRQFTPAPANLSGGEQRRVLLARALAANARVLVLDEPEAGLPKATARDLFEAVLARREDRTAVIVTHAPGVLSSTFNVVFDGGKLVDSGTHDELLTRCELYRTITATQAPKVAP
ncbi:MAG: ABC transporter ATP-binding protein [Polyangiaceae bacterium]|nr:ABC transporter ATP-binding protein [Polyangiaceae bacterium]